MSIHDIGPLRGSDEGLNHQIVDTFATVRESDRSWCEKIWGSFARRDGTLQVEFGLGKYPNRGVMDGHGGVSRGREQWTVRASRELGDDPEMTSVGPVMYEVIEPLSKIRFHLDKNDALDLCFDLLFEAALPPYFEERNLVRSREGRVQWNTVRYHQGGSVSGWVEMDGERHQVTPDEWFGFRDHSWGVRGDALVGTPPTDLPPGGMASVAEPGSPMFVYWAPLMFFRPDGGAYELQQVKHVAGGATILDSSFLNESDRQTRFDRTRQELSFDPQTRLFTGGKVCFDLESGGARVVEIEPVGGSGFFLKTGGYGGWKGRRHGQWCGPLDISGEYIADCWAPDTLVELGQLRDCVVRAREGDIGGYGIVETIATGVWPEFGLTAESDLAGF